MLNLSKRVEKRNGVKFCRAISDKSALKTSQLISNKKKGKALGFSQFFWSNVQHVKE